MSTPLPPSSSTGVAVALQPPAASSPASSLPVAPALTAPIPFIAARDYARLGPWLDALQATMPHEKIVPLAALSDAEKAACTVAIVANPNPQDVQSLPKLQWLHSVWAGVERLIADLGATDLKIVRLLDPQLANTMAEAVLAWTLYLHRDMPAYAKAQARAEWAPRDYVRPERKCVGLLGLGALGSAAAVRLLSCGFQVCGWSRQRKQLDGVDCYAGEAELQRMLARCDIVVCLLPLTHATRGLLDAEKLGWLPKGAALINFARGPIVVQNDLLAALDGGHLSHAVLDVFDTEPLPPSDDYWHHPQVTVLPHCSAPTDMQTASQIVAANIARFRQTGEIPGNAAGNVDPLLGY